MRFFGGKSLQEIQKGLLGGEAGEAAHLLAVPEGNDGGDIHDAVPGRQPLLLIGVHLGYQRPLRDLLRPNTIDTVNIFFLRLFF